ncbi:MAG: hypothetical protein RR060_01645 [Victivallaceae bacterium]
MKSSQKALIWAMIFIFVPLIIQLSCFAIQLFQQSAEGFEKFDLSWVFYLIYAQGLGVAFLIIARGLKKQNR